MYTALLSGGGLRTGRVVGGAVVVAGIATAIVVALWFVFYFMVFLPRGSIQ